MEINSRSVNTCFALNDFAASKSVSFYFLPVLIGGWIRLPNGYRDFSKHLIVIFIQQVVSVTRSL